MPTVTVRQLWDLYWQDCIQEREPRAWIAMKKLGFTAGAASSAEVAREGLEVDAADAHDLVDEAIAELKEALG